MKTKKQIKNFKGENKMEYKTLRNRIKDENKISLISNDSIFLVNTVNLYTIDSLKDKSFSFDSFKKAEKFFNNIIK